MKKRKEKLKVKILFVLKEDGIFYEDKDVQQIEESLRFHVENSVSFKKMMQRIMGIPVKIEEYEDIRFLNKTI